MQAEMLLVTQHMLKQNQRLIPFTIGSAVYCSQTLHVEIISNPLLVYILHRTIFISQHYYTQFMSKRERALRQSAILRQDSSDTNVTRSGSTTKI